MHRIIPFIDKETKVKFFIATIITCNLWILGQMPSKHIVLFHNIKTETFVSVWNLACLQIC